jgi:plasmid stabilization system protein ParE
MYKSLILPLAKQDIKLAATWYNERQRGLGKRFTANVKKKVHYICQNPSALAVRYGDTRTALIETFPYLVHFSVDENKKTVVICAVLSTSRDPKLWDERK